MPVTFDGPNLRIIETSVAGDNSIEVADIYSEWKRWLQADTANARFLPALRTVGGDPTVSGQQLGATFFLTNGWRLRPAELNHSLDLVGNLYVDGGGRPIVDTLGTFQVSVSYQATNLVDTVTVGSGVTTADIAAIAAAVGAGRASVDALVERLARLRTAAGVAELVHRLPSGDGPANAGRTTAGDLELEHEYSEGGTVLTTREVTP
ncbi:MAG: hypothetical protein AAF447_08475 [Myxococcota bacterium]